MPDDLSPIIIFNPVDNITPSSVAWKKSFPSSFERNTLALSNKQPLIALNVDSVASIYVCRVGKLVIPSINRQSLNITGVSLSTSLIQVLNFLKLVTSPAKIASPNFNKVSSFILGFFS